MHNAKIIGFIIVLVIVGVIGSLVWIDRLNSAKNSTVQNTISESEKTINKPTNSKPSKYSTTEKPSIPSKPLNPTSTNPLLVKTQTGWVQGKTVKTVTGKPIDVFLGIPFAKPPIGALRFKHPVPAVPWNGVLNATEYSDSCMQKPLEIIKHVPAAQSAYLTGPFNEDCLYLNVYLPNPRPIDKSVVLYIHSGGFNSLSASMEIHNPGVWVSEMNIIVVTINYRLGAFGLMYLNHSEIEPNAAMFDQIMAMKWVRDNIAYFGGDPSKVTLAGMSAGAMSAGMHMISPLSKGLFKRSIQESGSALFPLAVVNKKRITDVTLKLADFLGCPDLNNLDSVVQCLQKADADDIIENTPFHEGFNSLVYFPVVDGNFINKDPYEAYEKGEYEKVDLLIGFTKNEGTVALMLTHPTMFVPIETANPKPDYQVFLEVVDFDFSNFSSSEKIAVNKLYFHEEDRHRPERIIDISQQVVGDYTFDCGIDYVVKSMTKYGGKSHAYVLSYISPAPPMPEWLGVFHGASIFYSFGNVFKNEFNYTQTDRDFSMRIMKYWTNFARTGDPNKSEISNEKDWITWPQSVPNKNLYLSLAPKNQSEIFENFKDRTCPTMIEIIKRKHSESL